MSTINHEHRHVFIHVPKCAGTSMESMDWVGGNGHNTARQLVPKAPQYWSWGFVRHPLDRLASAYHGLRATANHKTPDIDAMTFLEYVHYLHDDPERMRKYVHTMTASHFLCDENGRVMVDFVGRVESIFTDWEAICRHVMGRNMKLPHRNVIRHPHWGLCYDEETRKKATELYQCDFDLWYKEAMV